MKLFLASLKTLGFGRLLAITGVGIAVLGVIGFVALSGSSQPMALLYSDLEIHDSSQVAASLEKLHVAYELKDGGATILVPSSQVDHLRLALAHDGLPAGGSVGYEVFDRSDSLTSNQFQQQMNQLRALEGELSRTIRTIRGVRNARVHLVLAKREPFAREQQEAKASIVIAMTGAQRMSDDEVQAIVNLVSAAVPGLKPQSISVVDNRGELLAQAGREAGQNTITTHNEDARRMIEQRLTQAVEEMLGRSLGPGHVRAEATVEMDFDRINETQERFDPEKQVVRHQQTVSDATKTTEPQATVSVQNNLPNPEPQSSNAAAGSSGNRQEENTSFEIDKTVRTMVHDAPSIKKISMAVLVDGITAPGADGKSVWRELTQAELDRVATLVKSAVGYDQKRGDHVDVVNMRFSTSDELADIDVARGSWMQFGKADVIWLVTMGLVALVALFSLGFVVRPLALKIASHLQLPAAKVPEQFAGAPKALNAAAQGLLTNAGVAQPSQSPAGNLQVDTDKDTMLNVASIQGEIKASSIRRLSQQVETHPDASIMVMRGWLAGKAS